VCCGVADVAANARRRRRLPHQSLLCSCESTAKVCNRCQ
jgi:hypothetical protein